MEPAAACFSGRTWLQQRPFRPLHSRERPRPAVRCRRVQCCASWGLPNGEREREEWTASEWQPCSGGEAAARENDWQHLQQQWQAQQQQQQQQQPPRAEAERPCSSGRPYEEPEQQAEEFFVPPWPASLAGGGAADGYHPLEFYPTSKFDLEWGNALQLDGNGGISKEHGKIYVILFGVGTTDTEGIYSLRAVEQDEGLPVDTIVAFENEDDALRYSTLLEATMDHQPTVWPIEWGELMDFCNGAGYRCRLEPCGSLLIPPDYNVGMTDWEKSLRLRRGEFQVLESEPSLQPGRHALSGAAAYLEDLFHRDPHVPAQQGQQQFDSNVVDSQLADPEQLELLKQSLERLLPRE